MSDMVMTAFTFMMLKCNRLVLQLAEVKASTAILLNDSLLGNFIKSDLLCVYRI